MIILKTFAVPAIGGVCIQGHMLRPFSVPPVWRVFGLDDLRSAVTTSCPHLALEYAGFGQATHARHVRNTPQIQENPPFPAGFHSWSRGELNPGPVTVPSYFYVRSLLTTGVVFRPPSMSQTTDGEPSHSQSPYVTLRFSDVGKSSNDARPLPEDPEERTEPRSLD